MSAARKRVAILISGRGSNMTALIAAAADPGFPAEVALVISDQPDAPGLAVATARGIDTAIVQRSDYASKEAHDGAIDAALFAAKADIVALAGYMRLLTARFVERWQGRMINIHPALLPSFKGLDTHRRALDAGTRIHGCTVHFVTSEMDGGPIIAQAAVAVLGSDTEETLSARVLKAEHRLYPLALQLVADSKVRMENGKAVFVGFADDEANGTALIVAPKPLLDEVDLEQLARITP